MPERRGNARGAVSGGDAVSVAYYNEIDPYAAQWLRNLIAAGHIAPGDVDERSIVEVRPDDLRGYTQCHFFAGIGGWSYALRLAGWADDRSVWTGSCPCQPFSSAAAGANSRTQDPRHLWPVWRSLIAECGPSVVFGEQVAAAGDWFDVVCDDLEQLGYAPGAAVLPAVAVGADHARPRLLFVGYSNGYGEPRRALHDQALGVPGHRGIREELAREDGVSRRMGALRAYGNAIHPGLVAEFVRAAA